MALYVHMERSKTSGFSRGSVVILACCIAVLFGAQCASDSTSPEEVVETEGERRVLDARAQSMLLEGERAFRRGAYEQALAYADSAEQYDPDAPVVPFFRGSIYTALERPEAARAAYQAALALDPAYPDVHLRLGQLEAERGRPRRALRLYRKEAQIAPTSPLYTQMGLTYAERGVPDSARLAYERALALDSTNARAHMMYGQLLEETGQLEAALGHSRQAMPIEPDIQT